ncbi:hypothetical protein OPQ81_003647 [Rhizoctonia solani]|nr:hypothetical protein OPQ81_003647 [Rhizoctonia solani]
MSVVISSIPQLSALYIEVKGVVSAMRGLSTGGGSRVDSILFLQEVIILLEKGQLSLPEDDAGTIRDLQGKLRRIIDQLSPRKRSIVKRARGLWASDGQLLEEARLAIDDILRLIQLRGAIPRSPVKQSCPCSSRGQRPNCPVNWEDSINEDQSPEEISLRTAAAYFDYHHHRQLAANDPTHRICLANSSCRLAMVLRKSGDIEEAARYSQEAVRIYSTLSEGGPGSSGRASRE